jgi:hypothetical protein
MLIDIETQRNKICDVIAKITNPNINIFEVEKLRVGVYEINHFNLDLCIPPKYKFTLYPKLNDANFPTSGVCDSYEQILKKCPELLEDDGRKFIISLTRIIAENQPEEGGWRWHKWGEYIGDYKPICEYIYDEKDLINEVFVYEIIEIDPTYEIVDDWE